MTSRRHIQTALQHAVAVLKNGGVVVFPTETAYGLAADPANIKAMRRVYLIKGREPTKHVPFIAADLPMAVRFARLSPPLITLAKKHWPGPLTLVGKKAAIRVSAHPVARALSKGLGRPIVSTSANISGEPACYSVRAVKKQFIGRSFQPDFYLDRGVLPRRKPSTLVKEERGKMIVLRQGRIRV
jgi:L-threonylcarbamoyladenylate synthase